MTLNFLNPYLLLLVPAALAILVFAARRRKAFGHTQVSTQKNLRSLSIVGKLPIVFFGAFIALLLIALARPVVPETSTTQVKETRDFVIAVDISGSMTTAISDPNQLAIADTADQKPADPNSPADGTTTDASGNVKKPDPTRLRVAQKAIDLFVPQREGDRVGLLMFDDEAYYVWPLSADLQLILKRNRRTAGYSGGGTNFDGPDGSSYSKMGPIQAAINHFQEVSQAKTKVLIMVTDGESNISEARFNELLDQLKKANIRVYTLGVGEGWVGASSQTTDLRRLTESSGGKVMVVGDASQMKAGFDEINAMEKSKVETQVSVTHRDVFQVFLYAATAFGILYLLSAAFVREDI